MANINIKTNFVDGEKLFAQQLNNNFKTIQEGMNADNKIIWQDGEEVLFKRYATNHIESLPILDGSIIYDVEKGRHYIDYNGERIQVGSAGKEVLVQDNEPIEEDNKIWIDSDFVNTMGTEVVNSLDGNETNMSPSVRAVKKGLLDNYSEDEQIIGTWIDGKPLYRQVLNIGDLPSRTTTYDIEGINLNDNYVVKMELIAKASWGQRIYPQAGILMSLRNNGFLLELGEGDSLSGMTGCLVLEYTKTTDSEVISDEV